MYNQRRLREAINLHGAGRFAEAQQKYDHLLSLNPSDAGLWNLRGTLAGQVGNLELSVQMISRAIALDPTVFDYYRNLATSYGRLADQNKKAGQDVASRHYYQQALGALLKALTLNPDDKDILLASAATYLELSDYENAIISIDKVLEKDPHDQKAIRNRSSALNQMHRYEDALPWFDRVLESNPDDIEVLRCRANALNRLGQAERSIEWFDTAIAAAKRTGKEEGLIASLYYARALPELALERFDEGWSDYEWRWKASDYVVPHYSLSAPIWKSEAANRLKGPLLITAEPGLGETLQFCRYIPSLIDRGYEIVWEVYPELHQLCSESFSSPNLKLISANPGNEKLFNSLSLGAYCGIMSLPHRLKLMPHDKMAYKVPYFQASAEKISYWRDRIATGKSKIGLVWAGNPKHPFDLERSLSPDLLGPLLENDHVQFYSLQKTKLNVPGISDRLIQVCDELQDFSDTAALIRNLDLVITVDTAVTHLAGGLNCPTWLLASHIPDWRWRRDKKNSSWYPSLQIFRQHARGDWGSALDDINQALKGLKE